MGVLCYQKESKLKRFHNWPLEACPSLKGSYERLGGNIRENRAEKPDSLLPL